jgi:hypothetical protein
MFFIFLPYDMHIFKLHVPMSFLVEKTPYAQAFFMRTGQLLFVAILGEIGRSCSPLSVSGFLRHH